MKRSFLWFYHTYFSLLQKTFTVIIGEKTTTTFWNIFVCCSISFLFFLMKNIVVDYLDWAQNQLFIIISSNILYFRFKMFQFFLFCFNWLNDVILQKKTLSVLWNRTNFFYSFSFGSDGRICSDNRCISTLHVSLFLSQTENCFIAHWLSIMSMFCLVCFFFFLRLFVISKC